VGTIVWPVFSDLKMSFTPNPEGDNDASSAVIRRASLVANNGFLSALGRPNRETVSTGREMQANLLQALELTNGDRFIKALSKGAESWISKYPQTDALITEVYRKALGRAPQQDELQTAMELLGESPQPEGVEDLLWAVMLLTEFQLIY